MRKFSFLLLFILASCGDSHGYSLRKISSTHKPDPKWEVDNTEDIDQILSSPFYYLAKGNNCYTFVSEDGQIILKFFRQSHLGRHTWQNALPLPSALMPKYQEKMARRIEKRMDDFANYKEAFENLREETGLIYLHLNRTESLNKQVKLVYKTKREDFVDMDKMEFILQRRAEVGFAPIEQRLMRGDVDGALALCKATLELVKTQCAKGYQDTNLNLRERVGFIGDRAIHIDINHLQENPKIKKTKATRAELTKVAEQLKSYFRENHEEHLEKLETLVNANLKTIDSHRQLRRT